MHLYNMRVYLYQDDEYRKYKETGKYFQKKIHEKFF